MQTKLIVTVVIVIVYTITFMLFANWNEGDDRDRELPAAGENLEVPVVVVAADSIKPYIPLTEDIVTVRQMRRSEVPRDAVQTFEEVERRTLRNPAQRGGVITRSNLTERTHYIPGPQIPAGFRCYTFSIEGAPAEIDAVQPQDRVDVYCMYQVADSDGSEQTETKKILSGIEVLSVGVDRYQSEVRSQKMSLLVEPEQAAILMMGERKGDITVEKTRTEQ